MKNIERPEIQQDIAKDISGLSEEYASIISIDMGYKGNFINAEEILKWFNSECKGTV